VPSAPARADDLDDEYVKILFVIRQGDDLAASGSVAQAKAKYDQALRALVAFQKAHPNYNPKMVTFRLNEVIDKVGALAQKAAEPPPGTTGTNAPALPATGATSSSARQVKLLDAGAEPRKALRLHPEAGDKQTLTLTLTIGGQQASAKPSIKMTLDSNVKQVAENGNITYTLTWTDLGVVEEPGSTSGMSAAAKAAFSAVKGLSGTGTVSSQGVTEGFKFSSPASAILQSIGGLQDLAGQLIIPLPAEAVGVGAKWEVKGPLKSQGMTMDQTATYELVSCTDDRLTIKESTVESAGAQRIQNPAMPAVKVDLVKMSGHSATERTIDLAHLLPLSGSGKSHTETSASMEINGQKRPMNQKQDISYQFEAK
jgi:hypothetical protein